MVGRDPIFAIRNPDFRPKRAPLPLTQMLGYDVRDRIVSNRTTRPFRASSSGGEGMGIDGPGFGEGRAAALTGGGAWVGAGGAAEPADAVVRLPRTGLSGARRLYGPRQLGD